jgi:hypothetical protein
MLIDSNAALDAIDEAISWKLRPALNPNRIFDEIASALHRHPRFRDLKITELDLALADLKREFAREMRETEWHLYEAFRCTLGVNDEAA